MTPNPRASEVEGCPSCHGAMYHRFKYGNKLPKMCAVCSECPTCCDCEQPEGEGATG